MQMQGSTAAARAPPPSTARAPPPSPTHAPPLSPTRAPPPPPSPSLVVGASPSPLPSRLVAVTASPPSLPSGPVAVTATPPASDHVPVPAVAPAQVRAPRPSHGDEGEKRRLSKAPLQKRLRSPVVPLVGSPGLNYVLSQASQRTVGVKRSSPTQSHIPSVSRRSERRKLKSEIWKDFDPVYDGNKLKEAHCKHCERVFVATRECGTSQCIRHLLVCEERAKINDFLDQVKPVMPEKWRYDPDKSYCELVRMIVLHELPFKIVEYPGFKHFVRSLNPAFQLVSRSTIRIDCIDMFEAQKIKLREALHELDSRVSLTADLWTSSQIVSYMCITAHFVDVKWKLKKKGIWFSEAQTPHDGINLFNIMLECLQDWGLQKKIFGITLDNASNNNLCLSYMKSNLLGKNLLPCKGDLLHGRCAAHVINLIAQDGLTVTCKAVDNIRESIKFVRSSVPRKKKFRDMIVQEDVSCKKNLSIDVATRWNSTHLMVKTALEYRRAFAALKLQDTSYTCLPTDIEWKTAESVCSLLEVFLKATMVVSGTLYPTAHLYFHELWKIHLTLEREASNEDNIIKSMVEAMKTKFMKYWKLSYLNICLPVILDPRYKFKFMEFCLKSGLESEATKCLSKVKKTFKELFVHYSLQDEDGATKMDIDHATNNVATIGDNPWDEWSKHVKNQQQSRAKLSELDIYLKDDVHPPEDDFDVLSWWETNGHKYPVTSRIAKDVLAVPASTVASESAFSTGGRILSDYRSRLVPSTVEALVCLQDWMRPRGTTQVNTIISDVVYATHSKIYEVDDVFGDD